MITVKKKPTIIILIPCWQRPEIVRQTSLQILQLQKARQDDLNINPLYILSEEDPHYETLRDILKGYTIVFYKNMPLGEKHNAGINYAISNLHFTYIMNLGSDTLIHPYLFDLYMPYILRFEAFFGINSIYFTQDNKCIYYKYIDTKYAIGAGRMIHRRIFDTMIKWQCNIYDSNRNRGLDTVSQERIEDLGGFKLKVIDAGQFPYLCELKSGENINKMSDVETFPNIRYVHTDIIKTAFNLL